MTTVLVTGGAGYVGSHACLALAGAGYTPVVFDNLRRGHRENVQWGPFFEGDLADTNAIRACLETYKPTAVLHFAASAYVGESVADPFAYYRNNVVGTLNLLGCLREAGINRLVFSSTCATYGVPVVVPITEDHPQAPINPYGASKLMVERILSDADTAYGVRSVALRYFNAAGADPGGALGERHEPETHALPLAIQAVLEQGPAFPIYGTDYPTPDGTAIRDYIHVSDLASAHLAALRYLLHGQESMAYNLGTGKGTSVRELLTAVSAAAGKPVPTLNHPRRQGDPPVLIANAARAQTELGWAPRYSDFADIVATAWHWHSHPRSVAAA